MTDGVTFRLLRVEGNRAEARAVPVGAHATFDDAVDAASRQPRPPVVRWRPDEVDGVWSALDSGGQGFVVHRIDG
jgi:2-keto-3-deoxy-L-rhamnonate aldolase RhmA